MANIRDTPMGQLLRLCGFRGNLLFPEEREGFHAPNSKALSSDSDQGPDSSSSSLPSQTPEKALESTPSQPERPATTTTTETPASTETITGPEADQDHILVDWYGDADAENPRNWSAPKKAWVSIIVCYYTFVVYTSSAIFTSCDEWVMRRFGVSQELVSLGLSMYVAGYGLGPMLFSPLSEIAYVGRNPPYLVSFALYFVVSIVTAVVADKSFAALMVLRFVQGFFGSPILASGGASLEDIYDWRSVPYAFIFWIGAMYCGPALGPLLSAYAVPHDWRWPLWEIVMMAGPLLSMLPFLPETSHPKILQKRAARLRRAHDGARYRSEAELTKLDLAGTLMDAMIKPLEIAFKDPAIAFVCVYGSLVYATYYSFFEAFPIVYAGTYGMTLGDVGQIFLCVVVGCVLFAAAYAAYLYYVFGPLSQRVNLPQESRLRAALPAVFLLPGGLFLFAWTARSDIHWIVPTIGIAIYSGTSFIIFQCIICYVPLSYPRYVASLFAGNDFCRSSLAVGFVSFSRAMYLNLGIAKGVSVLGGLSVMGVLGIWYLYFYGHLLRARSKFATS